MEQVALTRAGFLREASAIGFIQFPFPRRQGPVWYAERLTRKQVKGRDSCHCQRIFMSPKDSFWNMKGPQTCKPRAVCLTPVPGLRLKMGAAGYTLTGHVDCREDRSWVLLPFQILHPRGRATLGCCRYMMPPCPPIFSICPLHFNQA